MALLTKRVLALRVSQSNGFQAHVLKSIAIQCFPARRPASIKVCSGKPFARQKDERIRKIDFIGSQNNCKAVIFARLRTLCAGAATSDIAAWRRQVVIFYTHLRAQA